MRLDNVPPDNTAPIGQPTPGVPAPGPSVVGNTPTSPVSTNPFIKAFKDFPKVPNVIRQTNPAVAQVVEDTIFGRLSDSPREVGQG